MNDDKQLMKEIRAAHRHTNDMARQFGEASEQYLLALDKWEDLVEKHWQWVKET